MEVSGTLTALLPGGRAPGTHWIGDCLGPKAGLDAVARRKNPNPCRESNPSHSVDSLVTHCCANPITIRLNEVEFRTSRRTAPSAACSRPSAFISDVMRLMHRECSLFSGLCCHSNCTVSRLVRGSWQPSVMQQWTLDRRSVGGGKKQEILPSFPSRASDSMSTLAEHLN
jgi:hypothetical protein